METRYERKWVIKGGFLSQLKTALETSNFQFKKHHADRWVNSIYYDDMFNSAIYQNLNGDQRKQKIRLRWYGNKGILNPNLEIKNKNLFLTTKTNKKIFIKGNYPDNDLLIKLNDVIKSKSPFLINYSPITSTHYYRHYFISKNKKIRATIDDQVFYRSINHLRINPLKKNDTNLILELKYDKIYDQYVRENFTNNNSLRISKNSKFVNSFFY